MLQNIRKFQTVIAIALMGIFGLQSCTDVLIEPVELTINTVDPEALNNIRNEISRLQLEIQNGNNANKIWFEAKIAGLQNQLTAIQADVQKGLQNDVATATNIAILIDLQKQIFALAIAGKASDEQQLKLLQDNNAILIALQADIKTIGGDLGKINNQLVLNYGALLVLQERGTNTLAQLAKIEAALTTANTTLTVIVTNQANFLSMYKDDRAAANAVWNKIYEQNLANNAILRSLEVSMAIAIGNQQKILEQGKATQDKLDAFSKETATSLAEVKLTLGKILSNQENFLKIYTQDKEAFFACLRAIKEDVSDIKLVMYKILKNTFILIKNSEDVLKVCIEINNKPFNITNNYFQLTTEINNIVNEITDIRYYNEYNTTNNYIDQSTYQQNVIDNTITVCGNSGSVDIDVCNVAGNLSNVNNSGNLVIGNGNVTANNSKIGDVKKKNGCN